jgi:methionyl-tRNA formyltransferase
MRIVLIGQQDFGKATMEAFLKRGDTIAAVFCAPEKGRPDPLRVAAEAATAAGRRGPRVLLADFSGPV